MIKKFEFQKTSIKNVFVVCPFIATDVRGNFIKDYNEEVFLANGINHKVREVFYAQSKKGVLRGLHFQIDKQQAKLVRCIKGKIYDVIVDLRPESDTFGNWLGFFLTEENMLELYVPEYFGHGYIALEDSIVSYKCSEVFFPNGDSGIRFDDCDLNINWPFDKIGGKENLIISEKDKQLMSFDEYKKLMKSDA